MVKEENKVNFKERDFVGLFLALLVKNGIYKINELELQKKLYGYYQNPEYRELFQDICKSRSFMDEEAIDLHEGLSFEINFGGRLIRTDTTKLFIRRCLEEELVYYEEKLSKEGKEKIYQMASDFGVRHKIETSSRYPMNIYNICPNKRYSLVHGKYHSHIYSWELLTDGILQSTDYYNPQEVEHLFWDDPSTQNCMVSLKDSSHVIAEIQNASYVIMQGQSNDSIRKIKIYTNIVNSEQLEKIRNIANIKHEEDNFLISEKPYVRRIELK